MQWPAQVSQQSATPTCGTFFTTQASAPCDFTPGNNYAETVVTDNIDFGVVSISNFLTPSSTQPTDPFHFYVYDASGALQGSYTNQFFTVSMSTPNVFAQSSLVATASPAKVGEHGPAELTITPTTPIPASGRLVLVFPEWNPLATSPEPMLSAASTCTGVQNTGAALTCSIATHTLTISNLVDAQTTSELKLTISQLHYPLTTGGVSGIKATTYTADGLYKIDENTNLSLTGVNTAATLQLVGQGISVANSGTVSEAGSATFRFRVPVPVSQNCKFRIVFPLQMAVDSASTTVSVNYISFPRQQPNYSAPKSSGQARDIFLNYVCPDNYLEANQMAIFTINDVVNPSSTKATDTFELYILDENDQKIAELTSGVTWQAASGNISNLALSLSPSTVKAAATASVSFTPTHAIPANGKLLIQFPADVIPTAADTTACSLSSTTGVRADATCEIIG